MAVVLGLGYYVWTSSSSAPLLSDSTNGGITTGSEETLQTLSQLHTIRLDSSIFTDPVFTSLNSFSVTLPPAQAGRRNPFAPVGQ